MKNSCGTALATGTMLYFLCIVLPAAAAENLPEEITVTNTTLKNLRADLVRAEDNMHAIFNGLVDKEYRIVCEDVAITGSLIEHRVCEPNFRREAKTRSFRRARDGGPERLRIIPDSRQLDRELAEKSAKLIEMMEALARENPGLMAALAEVLSLRNAIAASGGEP